MKYRTGQRYKTSLLNSFTEKNWFIHKGQFTKICPFFVIQSFKFQLRLCF